MSILTAWRPLGVTVGLVAAVTACGGTAEPDLAAETAPPAIATDGSVAAAGRCLVRLHGKGGTGADTVTQGDVTIVSPTGNADGWGARQWLYFPDDDYEAARQIVVDSVGGCVEVIVNGFSNGASFAASLYCRGETLDGRLVGVVIDDPVTDQAVEGCSGDQSVAVTLYSTGALEETATPGWSCDEGDWTCQGGRTIGIDAYAAALGVPPTASPFTDHQWFLDAPELDDWR